MLHAARTITDATESPQRAGSLNNTILKTEWMVSMTLRHFYTWGTDLGIHWTWSSVGFEASLDVSYKGKYLAPPGLEPTCSLVITLTELCISILTLVTTDQKNSSYWPSHYTDWAMQLRIDLVTTDSSIKCKAAANRTAHSHMNHCS